jgi:hypothetical protein
VLKEMTKIAKCLKCLKLRYSINLIRLGSHEILIDSVSDFGFPISESSPVHKKDGAQRHNNFSHFSHFVILVIFFANFLGGVGI